MRGSSFGRHSRTTPAFLPRIEALEDRTLLTTYYVSPLGSDSNPGTSPNQAWQTINQVNNNTYHPGDSVLFQGGQTFSGGIVLTPADSGNSANPVTIGSYGNGRATIASPAPKVNGLYGQSGVQGIVIRDLIFQGYSGTQKGAVGLEMLGSTSIANRSDYLRIIDVDVTQFGSYGIEVVTGNVGPQNVPTAQGGWNDVQIVSCNTYVNWDTGIEVAGFPTAGSYSHTNLYIGHDFSYDNRGTIYAKQSTGNGIQIGDVDGATIERCTAYGNGKHHYSASGGGPEGIWAYQSNNVTIQYCESYDNHTIGQFDGGGFDLDVGTTNSVVQYCYSHDNDGAGFLLGQAYGSPRVWSNNTVRYCISQNDAGKGQTYGQGALTVWCDPRNTASAMVDAYMYGNSVYSSKTRAFLDNTPATGVYIFNNIFYATNGYPTLDVGQKAYASLKFEGNAYYSDTGNANIKWGKFTYTDLPSFRAATGQEMWNGLPVGLNADPQWENPGGGGTINNADLLETSLDAYKLLLSSPLFGQGMNLLATIGINGGGQDFYGDTVPVNGPYDIGAYQQSQGTGPAARRIDGTSTNPPRTNSFLAAVAADLAARQGKDGSLASLFALYFGSKEI